VDGLHREGIDRRAGARRREALTHATVNRYDAVVLDRDLPLLHGDTICPCRS